MYKQIQANTFGLSDFVSALLHPPNISFESKVGVQQNSV